MEPRTSRSVRRQLVRLWSGVFVLAAIAGSGPDLTRGLDQEIYSTLVTKNRETSPCVVRHHRWNAVSRPVEAQEVPTTSSAQGTCPGKLPEVELESAPASPSLDLPAHLIPGFVTPTLPIVFEEAPRVRLANELGETVIARTYGGTRSRVVMLPDGSVGWPNAMVYTDEAFRPFSIGEMRQHLMAREYRHFQIEETRHYLIFTQGSMEFARQSGVLLESLYSGLLSEFEERGFAVHESEFPLVAVIYRRESDFRDQNDVCPDVQAYYNPLSNRIFFFEHRDRELEDRYSAAMRKPQTVAHEGTHQILTNIGVQPRLAQWPGWLTEGLAEVCSPPTTNKGEWAGFDMANGSHLATIADLKDPTAIQGRGAHLTRPRIGPAPGADLVEGLFRRGDLLATDYALAWGLTHYLMNQRRDDFIEYLRRLGTLSPLQAVSYAEALRDFRNVFGEDLGAIGQDAHKYWSTLKGHEVLPYFAVVFEQAIEPGVFRRGTLVSQSPLVIRQWLESMASAFTARYEFRILKFTSRSAAFSATETWLKQH